MGRWGKAIACYKKAIELNPKIATELKLQIAEAHYYLGDALSRQGKVEEAGVSFQKAEDLFRERARLQPNISLHHDWVAYLRLRADDPAGALPFAQKAVKLDDKSAQAHWNMGRAQTGTGDHRAATASFRQALALGPNHPGARAALPQAERLATAKDRFPALLRGEARPADNAERLAFAQIAHEQKQYATATRLWAEALGSDQRHRYKAACSAALAAAGRGKDSAKLAEEERRALRRQALTWLRADLALLRKLEAGKPAGRATVRQKMRQWQKNADLAGLRDREALAKLPAEERVACEKLWADVAALLKKAEMPAAKEGKR
jgi:tetratricopeptide (TPR) repeat protein